MRSERRLRPLILLALLCAYVGAARADEVAGRAEESVRPGANETFLSEDLDVERFVDIFEGESREIAAQRHAIAAALRLSRGMAVADIGAGTGLFLSLLAERVGPEGRVYAVEISPRFLEHLASRAKKSGLEQVAVVRGKERSAELSPASIDLAFVCDTYHHFEYPRAMLASLREAIRPGGTLVVVDFKRIPEESRDWILEHVRAGKDVVSREIRTAGFEPLGEVRIEGLEENYMLRFRRP